MSELRQWLIALAVLAVAAPAGGWLGARYGKQVRGNAMMASILLGLGQATDPAKQNPMESVEGRNQKPPQPPGEPPTTES
jgi:hypothetical protein